MKPIEEVLIEEQDLKNVIEFLNDKEVTNDTNLEFYTFEELDKEVEDITSQIYKFIKLH